MIRVLFYLVLLATLSVGSAEAQSGRHFHPGLSYGAFGVGGFGHSGLSYGYPAYPIYGLGLSYDPYESGRFRAPDAHDDPFFRHQHRHNSFFPGPPSRRPPLEIRPILVYPSR